MPYKILVVDDEAEIADLIETYLADENYTIFKFYSATDALACIETTDLDLAILDVMLPDTDGFALCKKIREKHTWPIIMLTAKDAETDKITGLTLGADDYVTKPFTTMELLARVNSQLRRYSRYLELKDAEHKTEEDAKVFTVGGLEVHEETVEVYLDGSPVRLTPTEFKILLLLIKSPGRVFSAEEIYERVWNEQAINTDTIMVHIRKIREKIELNPRDPKYLKVVWGVGYKIEKQGRTGTEKTEA